MNMETIQDYKNYIT